MLESQALEITEDDVVDFMMHGFDRTDEDMIFGTVVRQAYLFSDCVLPVFNFRDEVGGVIGRKVCPFLISNPSSEPE